MDTCSHSASSRPDAETIRSHSPPSQDKISAYYSLVFPGWTFYIQMLSITIGRRCSPSSNTPTTSTAEQIQVDVDLGNLKSVSRLHAKIEYDQDEDRFVLVVIGRNGAWVDGVWCGAGSRATLSERSVHVTIMFSRDAQEIAILCDCSYPQITHSNSISNVQFCSSSPFSSRRYPFSQLSVIHQPRAFTFCGYHVYIPTLFTTSEFSSTESQAPTIFSRTSD